MCRRPSRFVSIAALVVVAACASAPHEQVDSSSLRTLPVGTVVGFTGEYGSHVWRGLPYAEPPVGELRWRAPRPAAPFEGTFEALETGEACPQYASVYAGAEPGASGEFMGSEDCLYLDVYAPRFEPGQVPTGDARLPVMLWIHGGGNTIGRAGFYDGGRLAQTQQVIVVTINYRLGPLGWFSHSALRAGSDDPLDRSGNFGTLDMIRALEWVQQNASGFGGDPDRVTIFGESAGGSDVISLLISPVADGLFHRAIVQSGSTRTTERDRAELSTDVDPDAHPNNASDVAARLLGADAIERMSAKELAAALRAVAPDALLAAYANGAFEGMIRVPTLIRDGRVIPDAEPLELLSSGAYHQVPVILGTNRDENKVFMAFDPQYVDIWFGTIPRAKDVEVYDATAQHLANAWKARGVDQPARRMNASQGDSVFAYRWDWDEEPGIWGLYDGSQIVGAAHGLEIAFVFGHYDLGPQSSMLFTRGNEEARELLAGQMMSYWAQFAYTGDPGRGRGGDVYEWRPWSEANRHTPKYLILDTPEGGGLRMATQVESMDGIVKAVVRDDRLPEVRQKCGLLRDFTEREDLSPAAYAAAGDGLCAAYALDDHPWDDVAAAE